MKSIKNKLEVGELNNISSKKMKEHHSVEAFKLGQKIAILVEQEKHRRGSPLNSKRDKTEDDYQTSGRHVGVKQIGNMKFLREGGNMSMETVHFPKVIANPRDAEL